MKSWLLLSIAVLLTALSLQESHPEGDFFVSESDMLRSIPSWDLIPIQTTTSKADQKIIFKADTTFRDNFFITEVSEYIAPLYYLPIYNLHRENEYFLLI